MKVILAVLALIAAANASGYLNYGAVGVAPAAVGLETVGVARTVAVSSPAVYQTVQTVPAVQHVQSVPAYSAYSAVPAVQTIQSVPAYAAYSGVQAAYGATYPGWAGQGNIVGGFLKKK